MPAALATLALTMAPQVDLSGYAQQQWHSESQNIIFMPCGSSSWINLNDVRSLIRICNAGDCVTSVRYMYGLL